MLRASAATARACGSRAKPRQQFNHDDKQGRRRCRCSARHTDVACAKCHPEERVQPARKPDSCGNSGCHKSPHDGHLFGKRDCEWCHSPTFKTLKNHASFNHREKTNSTCPRTSKIKCYDCHTKRSDASRTARASMPRQGQPPRQSVQRSSAIRRSARPAIRRQWKPPKVFNHARSTKLQADRQARRRRRAVLSPRQEPVGLRALQTGHGSRVHGLSRAQERARQEVPDSVHRTPSGGGCHTRGGQDRVRATPVDGAYHGAGSKLPAGEGSQGRAVQDCHTSTSQDVVREDHDRRNCERQVPRGLAAPGLARRELRGCHSSGMWDALKFDHNEPFPATPSEVRFRSRASTRRTSARTATRSATSRTRRRRARPRAATQTTTRTRAGSATSASAATSRPATTSSTTTR